MTERESPLILIHKLLPGSSYYLLLLVVLLSSCSTLKKTNKSIENSFSTKPVFQQGFAGLAVYDPEREKMLYEYNSNKYFTPASNTKLFTFYTGLKILEDSVPALKYSRKNDSLIFKGTGDPSFLNPDLTSSKVLQFLSTATEDLFYYPPVFTEKYFGPGWLWDDYNYSYSVERSAMPVYGNKVIFEFSGSEDFSISPRIFKDSILFLKEDPVNPGIKRNISANSFTTSTTILKKELTREVPFKYTDRTLLKLLQDTLKKDVRIIHKLPSKTVLKETLYSITTDSIYNRMLKESDNFIAEQILLMAAGKVSDTLKTGIAIDYMKKNHLKDLPDDPIWVDGSGLSRYNLFTPRTMVRLLEKISDEMPCKKLFSLMATGGKSGTLKNYYKTNEPYIFAKTGTLSNNHSLSGFLKTNSGKILIFSFMNSNYTVPTSNIISEMENILKAIRDNY